MNRRDINPANSREPGTAKKLCPVSSRCGGCQLLHMPYKEQLQMKRKRTAGLLSGICSVDPMIGMEDPTHYRNKVTAAFGIDRRGQHICGVYQEGTHRIIPVENCLIENQEAGAIIQSIRGLLKSFKIKTYDEDTGYGLLRHVQVRAAHATGQIMVILVCASPIFPAKNNFVKALTKAHPKISTILLNINDRHTSMVLGV